jgi:hypothetical protein
MVKTRSLLSGHVDQSRKLISISIMTTTVTQEHLQHTRVNHKLTKQARILGITSRKKENHMGNFCKVKEEDKESGNKKQVW